MRILWWSLIPALVVVFSYAPRDGHPWQWPVAIYGNSYLLLVAFASLLYGLARLACSGFGSRG